MLYAYPPHLTENGVGTKENTALSAQDIKFIRLLYDPKPTVTGPDVDEPTSDDARTLVVDGERLSGAVTTARPSQSYSFKVTQGRAYTIRSNGSTLLDFEVRGSDKQLIAPELATTRDLFNPSQLFQLPPGEYTLKVSYRYEGGWGEYDVGIERGDRT